MLEANGLAFEFKGAGSWVIGLLYCGGLVFPGVRVSEVWLTISLYTTLMMALLAFSNKLLTFAAIG